MGISRNRLLELFSRFGSLRIVLIGDLFLDRFYEIDPALDEPSLETGKTAHQVVKKRSAPGAGGTVLNNLAAMGVGGIRAISLIGADGDGWELLRHLAARGIDSAGVLVSDRVTTPLYLKPLFPEEGERFDVKNFQPTPRDLEQRLIDALGEAANDADAVILLDQVTEADCGVLTARVREAAAAVAEAHPGTLFLADSRAFSDRFRSVTVKCNNYEAAMIARNAAPREPFDAAEVFADLDALERRCRRPAIVTCNRFGIAVSSEGRHMLLPAVRHTGPIDICGAGDAATAGFAAALSAGATMAEAAEIANLASGVTVRKLGETGTASQEEMLALFAEGEPR